jgi:hypothetical protein
MSKTSNLQRLECLKTYINALENKRKRSGKVSKKREQAILDYHPAKAYKGE